MSTKFGKIVLLAVAAVVIGLLVFLIAMPKNKSIREADLSDQTAEATEDQTTDDETAEDDSDKSITIVDEGTQTDAEASEYEGDPDPTDENIAAEEAASQKTAEEEAAEKAAEEEAAQKAAEEEKKKQEEEEKKKQEEEEKKKEEEEKKKAEEAAEPDTPVDPGIVASPHTSTGSFESNTGVHLNVVVDYTFEVTESGTNTLTLVIKLKHSRLDVSERYDGLQVIINGKTYKYTTDAITFNDSGIATVTLATETYEMTADELDVTVSYAFRGTYSGVDIDTISVIEHIS